MYFCCLFFTIFATLDLFLLLLFSNFCHLKLIFSLRSPAPRPSWVCVELQHEGHRVPNCLGDVTEVVMSQSVWYKRTNRIKILKFSCSFLLKSVFMPQESFIKYFFVSWELMFFPDPSFCSVNFSSFMKMWNIRAGLVFPAASFWGNQDNPDLLDQSVSILLKSSFLTPKIWLGSN